MIINCIKRLIGWSAERKDYVDTTSQIQRQILKRRYTGEKQNKLYGNKQKFKRFAVCRTDLVSKDTENVILFKREV